MIRFIITCLFYTTIARWGYSEIAMVFPDAVPYLNEAIHKIQIPTHDNWSKTAIEDYVEDAKYALKDAQEAIKDLGVTLRDNRQG